MAIFLSAFIHASILAFLLLSIVWIVSIFMNNGEMCNNRIWVTFRQFKKIFDLHTDEYVVKYTDAIFGKYEYNRHYMHAGIVKVNWNIFYFYTPIGYICYVIYKARYIRKVMTVNGERCIRLKDYKGDL